MIIDYLDQGPSIAERIQSRIAGPFHFRLLLQPIVALILGARDGISDAKNRIPPYLFRLLMGKGEQKKNLQEGINSISTPLIIGIILDGIVQFLIFDRIRFVGAIIVRNSIDRITVCFVEGNCQQTQI